VLPMIPSNRTVDDMIVE